MPKFNRWMLIRLGLVSIAFVRTLIGPALPSAKPPMTWFSLGVIFAVFPVAMLVGYGVLFVIRGPRLVMQIPSWQANPFDTAHGEQVFHLVACGMLAIGAAALMRALVTTGSISPDTLVYLAFGGGIWIGLKLLTALRQKADSSNSDSQHA